MDNGKHGQNSFTSWILYLLWRARRMGERPSNVPLLHSLGLGSGIPSYTHRGTGSYRYPRIAADLRAKSTKKARTWLHYWSNTIVRRLRLTPNSWLLVTSRARFGFRHYSFRIGSVTVENCFKRASTSNKLNSQILMEWFPRISLLFERRVLMNGAWNLNKLFNGHYILS